MLSVIEANLDYPEGTSFLIQLQISCESLCICTESDFVHGQCRCPDFVPLL